MLSGLSPAGTGDPKTQRGCEDLQDLYWCQYSTRKPPVNIKANIQPSPTFLIETYHALKLAGIKLSFLEP